MQLEQECCEQIADEVEGLIWDSASLHLTDSKMMTWDPLLDVRPAGCDWQVQCVSLAWKLPFETSSSPFKASFLGEFQKFCSRETLLGPRLSLAVLATQLRLSLCDSPATLIALFGSLLPHSPIPHHACL